MRTISFVLMALGAAVAAEGVAPAEAGVRSEIADVAISVGEMRSAAAIERRRETCWRTNRATGQKFRIC